jgi:hypothetical protein
VLNQSDPDFTVLVACNDVPDVGISDPRVEFIRVPRLASEQRSKFADIGLKHYHLVRRALALQAHYLMMMDGDDLVSAGLVDYVRKIDDPNGYLIAQGYVLNYQTGNLAPCPHSDFPVASFDRFCGTSVIVTLDSSDRQGAEARFKRIMEKGHHLARDVMYAEGRPAHDVAYPAAVYVLNSGENLSQNDADEERLKALTALMATIEKRALVRTPALESDFCLNHADRLRRAAAMAPLLPQAAEAASLLTATCLAPVLEDPVLMDELAEGIYQELDPEAPPWARLGQERQALYRDAASLLIRSLVDECTAARHPTFGSPARTEIPTGDGIVDDAEHAR